MSAQVEADVRTISPEMPAMFDGMKLAAVATVLYVIVRSLNLKCPTAAPDITCQDTLLNRYLLKSCPILTKEWVLLPRIHSCYIFEVLSYMGSFLYVKKQ